MQRLHFEACGGKRIKDCLQEQSLLGIDTISFVRLDLEERGIEAASIAREKVAMADVRGAVMSIIGVVESVSIPAIERDP
jgi:hypothetical protein